MKPEAANSKARVSIIGCGWLGLPLAEKLIAEKHKVKGSTTSADKLELLKSKGIDADLIDLRHPESSAKLAKFLQADILIINIPPGTKHNTGEAHVEQVYELLEAVKCSPVQKLIYISSTSVYPNLNRLVIESDVVEVGQASNKILASAEELILKNLSTSNVVLRCGGLAGGNRLLVRHFAGKDGIAGGNSPVNLIHQDDVVAIIYQVITTKSLTGTYNMCAPVHPLKKNLYLQDAIRYGLPLPGFDEKPVEFKIIDGTKLVNAMNYHFLYPDPATFPHTAAP